MIYTIVLHHPARSTSCLLRTLESLESATDNRHVVDVIVQGKRNPSGSYPKKGDGYELKYADIGKNLGIGGGFKLGVERFLETGAQWLAKIDDDVTIPPQAWDILREVVLLEHERNGVLLGGIMMATAKTKTRLLTKGRNQNGIHTITPVDGHHWLGFENMLGYKVKWCTTEFVDVGCTVYPRHFFGKNCMPDDKLFVGGIGLDLVLQGKKYGYEYAVCTNPKSTHLNNDCHTTDYAQVRKNKKIYKESCLHFYKKWNIVPLPLAKAAGMLRPNGRVVL